MSRVPPPVKTPGTTHARAEWFAESGLRNQKVKPESSWRTVRSGKPEVCDMDTILPSAPCTLVGVHSTRTVNSLVFPRLAIRSGTGTRDVSQADPSNTRRPGAVITGTLGDQAISEEICL